MKYLLTIHYKTGRLSRKMLNDAEELQAVLRALFDDEPFPASDYDIASVDIIPL